MWAVHMVEAAVARLPSTTEAPAPEALAQTALSSSTNTPPPRFLPQPARASRSRARLPTPHPPPQWPSPTPRPPTSPTSSSRRGVGEAGVVRAEQRELVLEKQAVQVILHASGRTLPMHVRVRH